MVANTYVAPVPVDNPGTTSEEFIPSETEPQIRLYTKSWIPPSVERGEPPKAAILLVHGFNDHLKRFDHILPLFASKGIAVTAYDQRGYGVTAEKGMPGDWKRDNHGNTTLELLAKDEDYMLRTIRKRTQDRWGGNVPFFLMGHSMGGQLALTAVTRPPNSNPSLAITFSREAIEGLAGVIGSAPWLQLTHPPPAILRWLAPGLIRTLPNLYWKSPLNPKDFSKDLEVQRVAEVDPYIHPWVYLRALVGPLLNGPDILDDKYRYYPASLPLLIVHGDSDPIVSYEGSKQFIAKVQAHDKTLATMPGHLHEPLQEVMAERIEAANIIIEYVSSVWRGLDGRVLTFVIGFRSWVLARAQAAQSQGLQLPSKL